jgi:hypothetical protein
LTIDETCDNNLELAYKNQPIEAAIPQNIISGDKIKACIEMLDKYPQIHEKSIQHILKRSLKMEKEEKEYVEGNGDKYVKGIDRAIENSKYPDVRFSMYNNNISINVDYKIATEYSKFNISLEINEEMEVMDFRRSSTYFGVYRDARQF